MKHTNKNNKKKNKDLLVQINKLPDVLINEIYCFIPKSTLLLTNKTHYRIEHPYIYNHIIKNKLEHYIRAMVKQDNDFVLHHILLDRCVMWIEIKDYYYEECVYNNYIYFLYVYSIDKKATKCSELIKNTIDKLGLNKNQHKKKPYKYI